MKKRLLPYLILLPIILLIAYTDVAVYLKYIAIATIPLSIGLIVYMFIKSSAFYRTKKVLLFAFFALSLLVPLTSFAQTPMASMQARRQDQINYESQRVKEETKKWEQYMKVKATIAEIGRIPKEQRTKQQQQTYDDAKKEFVKLNKDLNIKASCSTTQELQEEISSNCWACDIANLFIEGADKVAINFYKFDRKNGISKSLLVLGLFGWLLIHVLKLLMTFGRGDIGAFFTDLFVKLLLVGGIFILISFPIQGVVNFVISPIFTLSATFGMEIGKMAAPEKIPDALSLASDTSRADAQKIRDNVQKNFDISKCDYCTALEQGDESQYKTISNAVGHTASQEDRVVSATVRNSILCSVCSIYRVTVEPTVLGQYLLCNSKHRTKEIKKFVPKPFYTDWDALLAGVALIVSFFSIAGLFSFYLVDTFFRIAIVLILMPLLIVAAAFKSTLNYTKKGFEIIIHAFFTYIIFAVFMTLMIQLYYHFLGKEAIDLIQLAFTNDYDKLREAISFKLGGRIVACSVMLALFVYFILKHVDEYITTISGISLKNTNGVRSFEEAKAATVAVATFVPKVFDRKWEGGAANENNSIQQKASKIREWGQKRTWLEGRLDEKIGERTAQKLQKAEKLIEEGHKIRGRLAKVRAKTGAFLARRASHTIIRTLAFLPKAVARNKYFNKTVGLLWQVGADGVAFGKWGYNQYEKRKSPKQAAKDKYKDRNKGPKK